MHLKGCNPGNSEIAGRGDSMLLRPGVTCDDAARVSLVCNMIKD